VIAADYSSPETRCGRGISRIHALLCLYDVVEDGVRKTAAETLAWRTGNDDVVAIGHGFRLDPRRTTVRKTIRRAPRCAPACSSAVSHKPVDQCFQDDFARHRLRDFETVASPGFRSAPRSVLVGPGVGSPSLRCGYN